MQGPAEILMPAAGALFACGSKPPANAAQSLEFTRATYAPGGKLRPIAIDESMTPATVEHGRCRLPEADGA